MNLQINKLIIIKICLVIKHQIIQFLQKIKTIHIP